MNAPLLVGGLILLVFASCKSVPPEQKDTPPLFPIVPPEAKVSSEAQAIAVATAELRRRGGNPDGHEWSAKWLGNDWHVTGWRIFYPENSGGSRFVPGGFISYKVRPDGTLAATRPGY